MASTPVEKDAWLQAIRLCMRDLSDKAEAREILCRSQASASKEVRLNLGKEISLRVSWRVLAGKKWLENRQFCCFGWREKSVVCLSVGPFCCTGHVVTPHNNTTRVFSARLLFLLATPCFARTSAVFTESLLGKARFKVLKAIHRIGNPFCVTFGRVAKNILAISDWSCGSNAPTSRGRVVDDQNNAKACKAYCPTHTA